MTRFLIMFLATFFVAWNASAGQLQFEPTADATREAISRGQVREFLHAMETMASGAEGKKDWRTASMAYIEASMAAFLSGQLQKSLSHAHKALELGERTNDPRLQTNAMLSLSYPYESLGQLEKAREWLQKGLEIVKKVVGPANEMQQARIYTRLGQNLLRQGEARGAIENISSAVQILDALSSFYRRVRSQSPAANQAYTRTQALIANWLSYLGNAYLKAGDPQQAIKTFDRGIAMLKAIGLKSEREGDLSVGLGEAYLAQKDFPRAQENFTKAFQMGEERRQPTLIQQASSGLGDVFLQTNKETEAIPHYKRAIEAIESTRGLLESEEFRTSFFEDKGQIYAGVMSAHLAGNNVEDAFNYNERARSRAFLDILGSKVQLVTQKNLLEEERALQERMVLLRARIGVGTDGGTDGGGEQLEKELEASQTVYNAFLARVRTENKEQASLMNVEPLTLKQLQERLDPGITVLEYFVASDAVWSWVVERDRIQFVNNSTSRSDLVSKVTSYRETISELGEADKVKKQSQELYQTLISAALPHIRGKELLIIPHDVLHYLPFQALLSPQGKYLIEDFPINYLSSASLMQFTQEKRKAKGELTSVLAQGGKLLTFGNPDLDDPKMALQFAEIEAKEIKSLYPQSMVYLNKEASEAKAKELSSQNDIIHFASHAELNESDPLASAILLAKDDKEDGRLEVREIFGMDLKASLIVLSACETGLGKLSSGDELVGLTRAFIYAGTPSVVASLWNVEDSSTAQLMASFYKNLKTMTKVDALRQAQITVDPRQHQQRLTCPQRNRRGGQARRKSEFHAPCS